MLRILSTHLLVIGLVLLFTAPVLATHQGSPPLVKIFKDPG